MALTKAELIANIAAMSGVSKSTVSEVLDTFAQEVKQQLADGSEITIPGIGKLAPVAKPARVGRNPATGAEVQIAAKTTVKFTALKALKDAIA